MVFLSYKQKMQTWSSVGNMQLYGTAEFSEITEKGKWEQPGQLVRWIILCIR